MNPSVIPSEKTAPSDEPAPHGHRRIPLIIAACCTAYALLAFFIHWHWFPIGDFGVESDFYSELVVSAQRLVEGRFSVANYPFKGPLYSFALAAVHAVTQPLGADWYRSAVLLNSLCAAAIIAVLFALLRRLFGNGMALATTVSTALVFEFFVHAHKASSDLLYLLLFFATVSAVIGARGRRRLFAAGILAGLAFLTRYSGGVLLVGGLLTIVWVLPEGGFRRRLSLAATFTLGFLAAVSPWLAANQSATGHFFNDGNLMNVVLEFFSGERARMIPPEGFGSLRALIAQDPVFFATHFLANIPTRLGQDMIQLVGFRIYPLVAAGTAGMTLSFLPRVRTWHWASRRRPNRQQVAFFVFAACSFLAMCLVFHRPRFSLPLAPAYFALGYSFVFGFVQVVGRPRQEVLSRSLIALLILAAVSAVQVFDIVGGVKGYHAIRPLIVLERAPRVRVLALETGSKTLLARKPHLAHYSGLDFLPYPREIPDWRTFLKFAYDRGADLIAVGEQERAIVGEIMVLNQLNRANGVTWLKDIEGLTIYRMDRDLGFDAVINVPEHAELSHRLAAAELADDSTATINAQFELGMAHMLLADWEPARTHLAIGTDLATANPDAIEARDHDYLKVNLAFCHLKLGEIEAGLALLGENLSGLSPVEDAYLNGLRHFVLGRLLIEAGRADEARNRLRQAYRFYRDAGDETGMNEARFFLGRLSGGEGAIRP